MKKIFNSLLCGLSLSLVSLVACAEQTDKLSYDDVASKIKYTFESNLFQLPPRTQGHYGIRLYRMTGDNKYLASALYDYYVVNDRMHAILPYLDNPGYIEQSAKRLTDAMSKGTRGKARRKALENYPEFIFYADELLRYAARLDEFGVALPEQVTSTLKNYDFLPGLTDKTMIRAWAAQLANYVYWLKQLGIADYSKQYKEAFIAAYPDAEDNELSRWHFRNKLYGLTHFIFAASSYYQQYVSKDEFGWILSYFSKNEQRIMKDSTDDIMAEVGISYLLMKEKSHPMVGKAKDSLVEAFNEQAGMIPSVSGKIDLASGEHRNVLAYMLYTWPEELTEGPFFHQIHGVQRYIPAHNFEIEDEHDGEH
ncbi:DUF3541 domain-containing protein [Thalassotalea sp. Y01]|uniref:DUF3541 domain-containing protein n=1 Tax=Thalassotalea sp. Y01 TaxID=2729613 RepID=UPI00145E7B46|nr:DUF3541 domain-containing protein [Thalassotalea sp. Y01]NMP17213.1 DUF3541 domain-containing protein [Thalassotalea sp. Y01]